MAEITSRALRPAAPVEMSRTAATATSSAARAKSSSLRRLLLAYSLNKLLIYLSSVTISVPVSGTGKNFS